MNEGEELDDCMINGVEIYIVVVASWVQVVLGGSALFGVSLLEMRYLGNGSWNLRRVLTISNLRACKRSFSCRMYIFVLMVSDSVRMVTQEALIGSFSATLIPSLSHWSTPRRTVHQVRRPMLAVYLGRASRG